MPTQTGTASTAVDLLNQLNTFLVANGWTKIRGETDLACNSPKAARYWRLLVLETDDPGAQWREIERMEWRETSGGPNLATVNSNYSFSSLGTLNFDIVGGTVPARSERIFDDIWWVQYDFGTPTTIREILMRCDSQSEIPARFYVQWSNDAFSWTTMIYYEYDSSRYTVNDQNFTFTWDTGTGFLDPRHAGNNLPRRRGYSYYQPAGSENRYRECCDDIWCWQGPGYDAARRVYVYGMPSFDLNTQDEFIAWGGAISINTLLPAAQWFSSQEGCLATNIDNDRPTHNMGSGGVTYWFYCNSKRFIIVTRTGVDDYTMSFVGFVSAFAQPDDYPFPLLIAGSGEDWDRGMNTGGTYIRDAQDPTTGNALYRRFDNVWRYVENHDQDIGRSENWIGSPQAVVYPKHPGVSGRGNFPFSIVGDSLDPEGHFLKNIDPTEQGDLPIFPCIIADKEVGFIGAMDGVFVVPQGGVLAPEATFTIGLDTYRVFSTRSFSDGNQYYCIKEV